VHEDRHAVDEAAKVVVDVLDLARLHAQRGVAVLPDARERDEAPGLALELLLVALALLVVVVVVVPVFVPVFVVVIVVVVVHRAGECRRARSG
jgi:hypothetical protein